MTMEGGMESFVVGGSYVFPLCSGCMNLHTWQQDPGAHRHCTLVSVPSFQDGIVFVSGVTRKENWVKGAWDLFVLSFATYSYFIIVFKKTQYFGISFFLKLCFRQHIFQKCLHVQ